ncbi:MAG: HAMP domain-containing histidine kinase [Ignavibacteria bacterium]|jgi:signal transduction histidine kinase|nr:HAMP domain-containing histidine kinase [Ignavibacteria bacterium]MDH7528318.1 HAMP domain-containing sensor histidine kinase [Ignavibacteria bacterium]
MIKFRREFPLYIKFILLFVASIIAVATLLYTNKVVKQLQEREKRIATLYAKGLEYIAQSNEPEKDYTFIFENIIQEIDFPLILTDADDNFNPDDLSQIRNVEIDSNLTREERIKYISELIKKMDETHQPILVTYADTIILNKIHFGDSKLVEELKYYPYVQLLIAAAFILLAYIGFSYVKKNENSKIWVGLSKETAHQLGTPLSSLMGWIELLKINLNDPVKMNDLISEVENDLDRLKKVADRFSKIGSTPEMKQEDLVKVIERVISYFERRIPQSGKNIELHVEIKNGSKNSKAHFSAKINPELFEWVLENLTKNAIDAIEDKSGKIIYQLSEDKKHIYLDVIDTGKGIDLKYRKEIFRPGFSTKKRGWGLGLSLAKRIIEEYHKGQIFVKSSSPGKGSVMRIVLKK